jgi:hypothetical protein
MDGWSASVRYHFTRRAAEYRALGLELFIWAKGKSDVLESDVRRRP